MADKRTGRKLNVKRMAAVSIDARTHKDLAYVHALASMFYQQQCGGGRRIIRKRLKD